MPQRFLRNYCEGILVQWLNFVLLLMTAARPIRAISAPTSRVGNSGTTVVPVIATSCTLCMGGAVSQLLSGQWFHLKNDDDAILYHFPVQRIVYGPSRTIPTFRLVLPTVLSGPSTLNDISACFPR